MRLHARVVARKTSTDWRRNVACLASVTAYWSCTPVFVCQPNSVIQIGKRLPRQSRLTSPRKRSKLPIAMFGQTRADAVAVADAEVRDAVVRVDREDVELRPAGLHDLHEGDRPDALRAALPVEGAADDDVCTP